ncbi:HupE / UreJ protein [Tenacibaculum sp. MAR_2009_124]|uniref:HupE/UreJ family protein n=1 Tax=Tenacibaculum sp. MAR_2009_124 TaxID=1250059 RepID=UPI0008958D2B|nr:HupE/UreJ family protein [Tenacibaculum sp. MAR_2009_124]SEC77703.1 HupE / UreJ protein [Tenacibaculum sp. MAR_2009_124]
MRKVNLKLALSLLLVFVPFMTFAHDVTSADQEILHNGGLWAYVQVGATHMLTGYDHLLFLAGVIFYLNGFKDILKFITVFTFGHCVTLIGATYTGITANEHLVDAVIALSVLYKGFENLSGFKKLNIKSPNLLLMVGLFGLIHGFGLSTRLQSFDIGAELFLAKILCFNVGVEIGQVLALIPIVFIITFSQKHKEFPAFYKAVNWYLVLAGIWLFIYQLYGYFNGH